MCIVPEAVGMYSTWRPRMLCPVWECMERARILRMRSAFAAGMASPRAGWMAAAVIAAQHKKGRIQDAAGRFKGKPILIERDLWRAAIYYIADGYHACAGGQ